MALLDDGGNEAGADRLHGDVRHHGVNHLEFVSLLRHRSIAGELAFLNAYIHIHRRAGHLARKPLDAIGTVATVVTVQHKLAEPEKVSDVDGTHTRGRTAADCKFACAKRLELRAFRP